MEHSVSQIRQMTKLRMYMYIYCAYTDLIASNRLGWQRSGPKFLTTRPGAAECSTQHAEPEHSRPTKGFDGQCPKVNRHLSTGPWSFFFWFGLVPPSRQFNTPPPKAAARHPPKTGPVLLSPELHTLSINPLLSLPVLIRPVVPFPEHASRDCHPQHAAQGTMSGL